MSSPHIPFSLHSKTALITGSTGGIGSAIAKQFHAAGATLTVSGSKQEKLDVFAKELGVNTHPIACDLTKLDTIDAFIQQAETVMGGIEVLVCNAGLARDTLAMRMKDEDWDAVINVNLTATFRMIRAAIKGMMKARKGRIIIITSVVAHAGNPGQANYCASKGGLTAMAKSLAHEGASRGITVNCIAPGFIATPMTDVLTEEQKGRILPKIPMNQMGTPEDIAAAALFLASDEARYITGQTLHVNGGMYMA